MSQANSINTTSLPVPIVTTAVHGRCCCRQRRQRGRPGCRGHAACCGCRHSCCLSDDRPDLCSDRAAPRRATGLRGCHSRSRQAGGNPARRSQAQPSRPIRPEGWRQSILFVLSRTDRTPAGMDPDFGRTSKLGPVFTKGSTAISGRYRRSRTNAACMPPNCAPNSFATPAKSWLGR